MLILCSLASLAAFFRLLPHLTPSLTPPSPPKISNKYTPLRVIGRGAYGVVVSAVNAGGERVAIKRVGGVFENVIDAKRTLREIQLLRHLKHENVISLLDVMKPPGSLFNDLYMVYELCDTDLHQVIRSPQPLESAHCEFFLYQLLRGLMYLHSAGVLHRGALAPRMRGTLS